MGDITVNLDGLVFSSNPTAAWKLATIQGWYDGTAPRANLVERPTGDGYFNPGKVYRQGRAITLHAFISSANSTVAQTVDWPKLAAIDTDGAGMVLSVTDDGGTKTANVWLAGTPVLTQIGPNRTEYTVSVVAADAAKYGLPQEYVTGLATDGGGLEYALGAGSSGALYYGANGFLGRMNVSNPGTAEAYSTIRVYGDLPDGFELYVVETGERLTYPRAVAYGDYIDLDNRTGRARINGLSDVTKYMTSLDFFSIPANSTRTIQFRSVGTTPTVYNPTAHTTIAPAYR